MRSEQAGPGEVGDREAPLAWLVLGMRAGAGPRGTKASTLQLFLPNNSGGWTKSSSGPPSQCVSRGCIPTPQTLLGHRAGRSMVLRGWGAVWEHQWGLQAAVWFPSAPGGGPSQLQPRPSEGGAARRVCASDRVAGSPWIKALPRPRAQPAVGLSCQRGAFLPSALWGGSRGSPRVSRRIMELR